MNMEFERKLEIPMEVKAQYPITPEMAAVIARRREELCAIFDGRDDRLILIAGPCSADREDAAIEYLSRLRRLSERVEDRIFLIPRLFTNKPRTDGDGYKGILHQPNPSARPDLYRGILLSRALHMRAVRDTGFSCADEMLYPENHKYFDDLLAYVTVGARSVEDQQHRLTASGVDVPVGMKNPTGGDLHVLLSAIHTAQRPHSFIYRGWAAHSAGNPYAHAILRGYTDLAGRMIPNYGTDALLRFAELYAKADLMHPAILVDANHANSGKDPFRQPEIVKSVLAARKHPDLRPLLKGVMIESYLEDGSQPVGGGRFGQSITDACLGWDKTERLILEMADSL